VSLAYFVLKLIYWDRFSLGSAPLLIGLFFFSSVQLFFIGLLGEYVAAILTYVQKRPLVVEQERINGEASPQAPVQSPASCSATLGTPTSAT
jgi:hypothetical protein